MAEPKSASPTRADSSEVLARRRVLVTGGTGSLGQALVRRLLTGEMGMPEKVIVFSRDEAKQHEMRLAWSRAGALTDDVAYQDYLSILEFKIGDVRDRESVLSALRQVDVVFHAAALKQVPSCEYAPVEAVKTNVVGAWNLVAGILGQQSQVTTAIAVSTDKACKPVNVMGMTKALQERVFVTSNLGQTRTSFMCVRYGNVISSRGSVIPLFLEQIRTGGPVTVTLDKMTRFLLTLDRAVDTVFAALRIGEPGDTLVPKLPAAYVMDIARAMIGDRNIRIDTVGIRPGEKIDEVMVSEEEVFRTIERGDYYVIRPVLPELTDGQKIRPALIAEYSSRQVTLDVPALRTLLKDYYGSAGVTN
jgi:FlaA1/EpsC-like NDP-sugar epimerase